MVSLLLNRMNYRFQVFLLGDFDRVYVSILMYLQLG